MFKELYDDVLKSFLEGFQMLVDGVTWSMDTPIGRWVGALCILLLFFTLRRFISRFILGRIDNWFLKNYPTVQSQIIQELETPLRFIPVILGIYFGLKFLDPANAKLLLLREQFFKTLWLFTVFWSFYNIVHPASVLLTRYHEKMASNALTEWVVRLFRIMIFIIGIASILEVWGIKVGPIIAGLGLFGMAVALGAQDMFKNVLAGISVISENRFKVGDIIQLEDGMEGFVEHIGFRSTLVRKFDKAPVYVPNTFLSDTAVINYSSRKYRRIDWKIGLEYRTTSEQLHYIKLKIEDYLRDNPEFSQPPESFLEVRLEGFADSSISLLIYCFTNTRIWTEYLAIKEKLAFRVKEIVEEAGAAFAFPSQSLYLEQNLNSRSKRGNITAAKLRAFERKVEKKRINSQDF